jgi:N-acetylmuramoyl-L-alanine amidase
MRRAANCKLTPFLALIGKILVFISIFLLSGICSKNTLLAASAKTKTKVLPYTVILDPGHGGEDKGAKGVIKDKTFYEKDIALAIAIRIDHILKDRRYWKPLGRHIDVVFTRKTDKTVALPDRAKIAQGVKADLYLSIHNNFEPSGKVSGVETYILKNDDSSSKKLVEIQARGDLHGYAKDDPTTALLLNSVAADATMASSKLAAELIHKSLVSHLARDHALKSNRGMRQALLFVLLNAQTPAVLMEAFYMSHPKDLAFITVPANRQKIAEGIAIGMLRFLALK